MTRRAGGEAGRRLHHPVAALLTQQLVHLPPQLHPTPTPHRVGVGVRLVVGLGRLKQVLGVRVLHALLAQTGHQSLAPHASTTAPAPAAAVGVQAFGVAAVPAELADGGGVGVQVGGGGGGRRRSGVWSSGAAPSSRGAAWPCGSSR